MTTTEPLMVTHIVTKPDYSAYRPDVADGLRRRVDERHTNEVRSSVDRCVNQVLQKWIDHHGGDSLSQGRVKVDVTFEPMVEPQTGATATLVAATATEVEE